MKKSILSLLVTASLSTGFAVNTFAAEVTVKEGDTLSELAEQKDVSVQDIKEWNDISGDVIHPEDKLNIEEYYNIVEGDSLWEIAEKNDISVQDLKDLNNIDSHIIHPGDEIIIDKMDNKKEDSSSKLEPKQKVATKVEKTSTKDDKKEEKSDVKEITVEATAYTANCEGCSGTTKTGIDLKANPDKKVIAVDPNVIPLGSKVHVEGYGDAIAGDIGGAIKGNRIDVFIPSKSEAKQWGRKDVTVKILD